MNSIPDIAFIGGGNMARALIAGLLRSGQPTRTIHVAEPEASQRQALARDFGVQTHADNGPTAAAAPLWVLATKPQVLRAVCEALADQAQMQRPLVVSIAAGVGCTRIERWLGGGLAVVRCMPNTAALLGAGVTALYAGASSGESQRQLAETLLRTTGATVWVDEEAAMDAVTATSGSGPAYLFLLAEAMQAAAEAQGLPAATARLLVVETLAGASRMLKESGEEAATLRQRVTSPGGTTQAALEVFAAGGFTALVAAAMHAACMRSAALSQGHD